MASLPISHYTNLLTSQYRVAPRLNAWLTALLQPLDDASTCLTSLATAFDLTFAYGVQLDVIGARIGVPRLVNFQPSGGVSPVLDDGTYRLLLQARVAYNSWDGTIDGLQSTWQTLFPGGRIVILDAQNMTATVTMSGAISSLIQDLITHDYIVPRPETVQYNYVFSTLPAFGFDRDDTYVGGFDHGKW